MDSLPAGLARWAGTVGFQAKAGQWCMVPDGEGGVDRVVATIANTPLSFGALSNALPHGVYRLPDDAPDQAILAWAMGGYEFSRYRTEKRKPPRLAASATDRDKALFEAVYIARDLINTPANDMGPDALEAAFRKLASKARGGGYGHARRRYAGRLSHAARGRARQRAGSAGAGHGVGRLRTRRRSPSSGKGVTFDTGGLNIKSGATMGLMKKDMGGAANVMALAHAIMAQQAARAVAAHRGRGGKLYCRQRLPPRRHSALAQGADGRDRQHGRRGAAGAGRLSGAGRRGEPRTC